VSIRWQDFTPRRGPTALYRQVAAYIRDAIERGDLKPGDGLPGEQNLADAMTVSVDTIRAALKLLREEGLIETATGIGSFVK
jgi:DNA-binding GntR family transcriptional regulator